MHTTLWERTVRATEFMALVGFLGLFALALVTTLDILLRWLANYPLHGVNDVTAIVMAVVIAACLPANLARKQNISVEFLGTALGRRGKAALDAFGSLLTLVFIALLAWRFVIYADELTKSGQTTWVLQIPIGPGWWIATAFFVFSIPVQAMVLLRDTKAALANGSSDGNIHGERSEPAD